MRELAVALVLTAAAGAAAEGAAPADGHAGANLGEASRLELAPVDGGLRIHVRKRGLFAAFAHDHDFEVTRWEGRVDRAAGDPSRATVTVTAAADSLRDREKGLSDGDREKVEAQTAGPAVLDAARSPEIVYRAEGVAVPAPEASDRAPQEGVLHGELTLRGRTRPVDASYRAERDGDGWRLKGKARFRQSDFGVKPFSGAGGTVGVKDEVEVTFAVTLRPPG